MEKRDQSITQLQDSLDRLDGLVTCSKLQILGGEPLLHPSLLDAMRICHASPMSPFVVIKTNGMLLHKMEPEFWDLSSKVIVSVYPTTRRILEKRQTFLEDAARKYGTDIEFRYSPRFNHITKPHRTDSSRIVNHVFEKCRFKDFCISISGDRLFRCSISVNAKHTRAPHDEPDSIPITDAHDFEQQVRNFLSSPTPISSCRYCLGSSGAEFEHTTLKLVERRTAEELNDYYR